MPDEDEETAQPSAKVAVEIWKKIVDVQQHFNDLELRIRNFALALTAAFLALGGFAIKEKVFISLFGNDISVASLIVLASIVPLSSFYFMDRFWYHRLLEGSVHAGIEAEQDLRALGYRIALGSKIGEASPVTNFLYGKKTGEKYLRAIPKRKLHSRHKIDVFYGILLVSLVAISVVLGLGVQHSASTDGAPKQGAEAGR